MGLQRETASRGALALYSKIIFATLLERIVFHTFPTFLSVVGALMIVGSALYIVVCFLTNTRIMSSLTDTCTCSSQKRKPGRQLANPLIFLHHMTKPWSKVLRHRAVELEVLNTTV